MTGENRKTGAILVLGEQNYGRIHHVTYEMLGKAAELSEKTGAAVNCLIAGPPGLAVEEIAWHGAETVYYLEDACFGEADELLYRDNLLPALRELQPSLVLIGATAFGRSLAPRLAAACGAGLTADCTDLQADTDGRIIQIRPAFSDNILAHIKTAATPQMATIRYKEFREADRDDTRPVRVKKLAPAVRRNERIRILRHMPAQGADITSAEIVVAAGRGIRRREDMRLVEALAEALGGVVAASRALVDAGIAPSRIQVGYSGHRVKPRVYIACGISGAPQHLAGMKESGRIVAVNSDASAPIFRIADLGYVGDLYELLPQMTRSLKENRQERFDTED